MLSKIFFTSLGAKDVRIAKITNELKTFKSVYAKIIFRMIKQGDTKSRIRKCICKISERNVEMFRSFSPTCNYLSKLLL